MSERNGWEPGPMDRRDFLKYSISTGVVLWAGPSGLSEAQARGLFEVRGVRPSVFPQSVASGDPQPDGIVLWTRVRSLDAGTTVAYEIARDAAFERVVLRGKAETGAARDNVVKVQIDNRPELKAFRTYYYRFIYDGYASLTGRFKTLPAPDSSPRRVRFGYVSCQDYTNGFYTALAHLAEEDVDFVVHLGDYIYETVDASSFQGAQVRTIELPKSGTAGEADTLEDYRFLYKKYRSDPNLQRVHENFAFITIWDDHEFANDCYRSNAPDAAGRAPEEGEEGGIVNNPDGRRRAAANRAWVENTPVGVRGPTGKRVRYEAGIKDPTREISIYRTFVFGDLLELVMSDERLYRDGPPCGLDTTDRLLTPGCGGEEAPGRTMLGEEQLGYFLRKMARSTRAWKIWGNETMFMQLKVADTFVEALRNGLDPDNPPELPGQQGAEEGVYFNLDQWDGYQAERERISRSIQNNGVENFVIVTGDLHTFIAGYARRDYDAPYEVDATASPAYEGGLLEAPPQDRVGVCFMGGSVTSSNLVELATLGGGSNQAPAIPGPGPEGGDILTAQTQSANPHISFLDSTTHGYNLIEVTPEELTCTMRAVSSIREPRATLRTLKVFKVPSGTSLIYDMTPEVQPVSAPSTASEA